MELSPFQMQYEWEREFTKTMPDGVTCSVPDCTGPLYLVPSDAKPCANCGAYFKPPSSHGRKNSCHDCASAGAAWNSYMGRT